MADLNESFLEFNKIIKLSSKRKKELIISRNAVRERIKKYIENNSKLHTVKFKSQGSFSMNTSILPLSGEYDVDDGVYIFGKDENRPTPSTVHNWIKKAVVKITNQKTIDKNSCVRLQYAKNFQVDLTIYYKKYDNKKEYFYDNEDIPKLAHKGRGWFESDPYAFKLWFGKVANKQLKRIVRYLKAWSDNKQNLNLPSGLVFTILAVDNFVGNIRDDKAFLYTLISIQNTIDDKKNIWANYVCKRPTINKTENLLLKYSTETTKKSFLDALQALITSGKQALKLISKKDACAKWQEHLGDRFPCSLISEDDKELANAFTITDQIRYENKSA